MKLHTKSRQLLGISALALLVSACSGSEGDQGALSIQIQAEDVIVQGLSAGDGNADIKDGWNVSFDKYVAGLGDVELYLSSKDKEVHHHEVVAVDLRQVSSRGQELFVIDGLAEGRWDFSYSTLIDGATKDDTVSEDDFNQMLDGDLTYIIEGELSQAGGTSCPPTALANPPTDAVESGKNALGATCYENPVVRFEIATEAETYYGPCEIDGLPGVVVTGGKTNTATITIHGDHIFFNGFPTGAETSVTRLAQWLADCDLNLDGTVTMAELESIDPSDVLDPDVFQLGGSPITPLNNMATYIQAQLKTQGHYQGEGECPVDGVEHDHEHDHDH